MVVKCDKVMCKFNEINNTLQRINICRYGSGYDYSGGDIQISKTGYCKCYSKKENKHGRTV